MEVRHRGGVGRPGAVRREGEGADGRLLAHDDAADRPARHVQFAHVPVERGEVQLPAVRAPLQVGGIALLEIGQAGGFGHLVGRRGVDLGGRRIIKKIHHGAFLGRQGEDVAAGHHQHAFPVGREAVAAHGQVAAAVFGAAPDVVVGELDVHLLRGALLHVVPVDVAAVLEDHEAVGGVGRELAVVFGEGGHLAALLRAGVVHEQVHRAVAVGEVVDLVADPHREDVLGVVVGDLLQLGGAHRVDPDVVGLAAPVVLPGAEFAEHPVHREFLPVRGVGAEAALGGGDELRQAAFGVHQAELAAQAAETPLLAAVDDPLAVGRPAHHDIVGPHPLAHLVAAYEGAVSQAPGLAAGDGDGIDFRVAVVLGGEGHRPAVRRDFREALVADVGGEFHRTAAVDADAIEVACIAEYDFAAADGRETQQARFVRGGRCEQRQGRCQGDQGDEDSFHIG